MSDKITDDKNFEAYHTKRYDGGIDSSYSYMRSFTKQGWLEYLAKKIENETEDYCFDYEIWEKTVAHCDPAMPLRIRTIMTDGTPAMGLTVYRGSHIEETTINFVNEKQLPVTWHDVEMFMKNKELEHETITDIPSSIEEPESEPETSNEKEI